MRTLVAGTFDRLHIGHKALLDKAAEVTGNDMLIVGLTSDKYAKLKKHSVRPYSVREEELLNYLLTKQITFYIIEIDSVACFDEVITDWNKLDALIMSEETIRGGFEFRQIYRKMFKRDIRCIIVPVIMAKDGKRVSSTRILNNEIDLNGNKL